jgi:hypothetical protein
MNTKLADFFIDQKTGVYTDHSADDVSFTYSDSAEDKIFNIIKAARDLSSSSEELEKAIDDWPTRYHFSNLRSNILRSLDFLNKDAPILEIGAGCGAITRYLGENFKSVDAIEGTIKRAVITAERCKDLDNVKVYCSPLQNIGFDRNYNIVTLIGVMEYAPVFYSTDYRDKADACLAMLKQATSALKEDGVLILAIENSLGLKYWSGCKEDHTGRLFEGIHGYPQDNTPVTFSKKELTHLMEKASLKNYEFFHPFPDYKLANTILREIPEPYSYYLHNWITMPFEDYAGQREFSFNEVLTARSLVKAGLIYEFSNSFVVIASISPGPIRKIKNQPWIAKRFSTNRILPFRIVTELQRNSDYGLRTVHKRKLFNAEEPQTSVKLNPIDSEWVPGDSLQILMGQAIYQENNIERLLSIIKDYHNKLIEKYSTGEKDKEGYPLVAPNSLDFVPCNIIINGESMSSIDQEWVCSHPISADYVIYRGLFVFFHEQSPFILRNMHVPNNNLESFMVSIIRSFYPQYGTKRQEINRKIEECFQNEVSVRDIQIPSLVELKKTKFSVLQYAKKLILLILRKSILLLQLFPTAIFVIILWIVLFFFMVLTPRKVRD